MLLKANKTTLALPRGALSPKRLEPALARWLFCFILLRGAAFYFSAAEQYKRAARRATDGRKERRKMGIFDAFGAEAGKWELA